MRLRVDRLADLWEALGWQPTVWLHWTLCHMVPYLERHRTLVFFSSIPTESRHRRFKRDVCQAFHGSMPGLLPNRRTMSNVLNLQALDAGLLHHHAHLHTGTDEEFWVRIGARR